MKGLLPLLSFLFCLLGLSHGQQECPPVETLLPCTCTEASPRVIYCLDVAAHVDLKETFDRASRFIGDDVIFDNLVVYNISHTELPEGTFGDLKFLAIAIYSNPNLEWISPRAFGASRNVTTGLHLRSNKLHNDAPRERDIFEFMNAFVNLHHADLYGNLISTIPPNAFRNLPSLETLHFGYNRLSTLGNNAFNSSEIPKLRRLGIDWNRIPAEGLPEQAFAGISTSVHVQMRYNRHDFLEQRSYETLFDRATLIQLGEQDCTPNSCKPSRVFNCDERADWICAKQEVYRPKLGNEFACKEETGFETVWEYCGNRTIVQ